LFRDIQSTAEAVTPHSRPDYCDKQCLDADMVVLVACLKVVFLHLSGTGTKKQRKSKNMEPVSGPNFELDSD